MVKVKYCGLTKAADVKLAEQLHIDAIGFVFVKKSPRYIAPESAQKLLSETRPKAEVVALFANQTAPEIRAIIEQVKPDVLQFHGNETAAFCEQFEHRYWKAIPMLSKDPWLTVAKSHPKADKFLLDAFGAGRSGGSGDSFDWFEFPVEWRERLILAGGLNVNNIHMAFTKTRTQYVDVSSGIESQRGVKSAALMKQFCQIINNHH